jgi:serine protease Do
MFTWIVRVATACVLLPAALAAKAVDVERMAHQVFRVEAHGPYGRLSSGSGVMVGPHMLVTNCHVVVAAQEIQVAVASGRLPARLLRGHAERDLCLLEVPDLRGSAVTLGSTADKRVGEPLVAVGYPSGAQLTVSRGHIEGLFTYLGTGRVVQGSAHFSPGKSGGALFDEHGRLIGILTFKSRVGGPYHFAVPVEWVDALIRDIAQTAEGFKGTPFWQHTDQRQPTFLLAAALLAEGDCDELIELATQWLVREPGNPEAVFVAKRASLCKMLTQLQRPFLQR